MTNKIIKCRACKKPLGRNHRDFKTGVMQIGQGFKKDLITFCNKKCLDKYDKYKLKGKLWRLYKSKTTCNQDKACAVKTT